MCTEDCPAGLNSKTSQNVMIPATFTYTHSPLLGIPFTRRVLYSTPFWYQYLQNDLKEEEVEILSRQEVEYVQHSSRNLIFELGTLLAIVSGCNQGK